MQTNNSLLNHVVLTDGPLFSLLLAAYAADWEPYSTNPVRKHFEPLLVAWGWLMPDTFAMTDTGIEMFERGCYYKALRDEKRAGKVQVGGGAA